MSKLQDRLGTACHVEVHTRQSRDSRDAFVPVEPDVTAPRDCKSGITFSHGKNVSIPQRTLKKIAADMIDCPDEKNRAGLYDTITIEDESGESYTEFLDFEIRNVPDVFNQFRGKLLGAKVAYLGFTYKLINIEKAGYHKGKIIKHSIKKDTSSTSIFRRNIKNDIKIYPPKQESFYLDKKMIIFLHEKHHSCCGEKIKPITFHLLYHKKDKEVRSKLQLMYCKHCGKYYMNHNFYSSYFANKDLNDIKIERIEDLNVDYNKKKSKETNYLFKDEDKIEDKSLYHLYTIEDPIWEYIIKHGVILMSDNEICKYFLDNTEGIQCYDIDIPEYGPIRFIYLVKTRFFYTTQLQAAKLIDKLSMQKINDLGIRFLLDNKVIKNARFYNDECVEWIYKKK